MRYKPEEFKKALKAIENQQKVFLKQKEIELTYTSENITETINENCREFYNNNMELFEEINNG